MRKNNKKNLQTCLVEVTYCAKNPVGLRSTQSLVPMYILEGRTKEDIARTTLQGSLGPMEQLDGLWVNVKIYTLDTSFDVSVEALKNN
jgi:hypothetical protein